MARKPSPSVKKHSPRPSSGSADAALRTSASDESRNRRTQNWVCWGIIVLTVAIAWANSLSGPFVLDDEESIVANTTLRTTDLGSWLNPPAGRGETVSGRPILNLSFALNYLFGELDVRGYHLVNVVLHCLSGLLLFGLLRRTPLLLGRVQSSEAKLADQHRPLPWLALVITLLWLLHPLQTAAVSYVSQRAEVLAGFFYLLVVYAFLRAAAAQGPYGRLWSAVAIFACILGVATKETVVTVPLMVWVYDRTFLAGSFAGAWRARSGVYVGLFLSWLVLGVLVAANAGRGGSAGVGSPIAAWTYLLTQCEAIGTYLRLTIWPVGQVFDYGMPRVTGVGAVWLEVVFLTLFGIGSIVGLWRKCGAGFWSAWFFVLISPTSSVVTIATQTVAEHRMYLPLLGVILLLALLLLRILERISSTVAWGILFALPIALGTTTFLRNEVYRSSLTLWFDTVAKRPDNARAHHNLGVALARAGRREEARGAYKRVLALQPTHAFAHFNLGVLAANDGDWASAAEYFRRAIDADRGYVDARVNLADALRHINREVEGLEQYRIALELTPNALDLRTAYASALIAQNRISEGMDQLQQVLRSDSKFTEAHYQLGCALEKDGRRGEAEAAYSNAVQRDDVPAKYHLARGNNQRALGRLREAEVSYRAAVQLQPHWAEARYALGTILAGRQAFAEAIAELRAALVVDAGHIAARNNLGNCLLVTGQIEEAIVCYDEILKRNPGDMSVRQNRQLAVEFLKANRSQR